MNYDQYQLQNPWDAGVLHDELIEKIEKSEKERPWSNKRMQSEIQRKYRQIQCGQAKRKKIVPFALIREFCEYNECTLEKLQKSNRKKQNVRLRQAFHYWLVIENKIGYQLAADITGYISHATVIHSVENVKSQKHYYSDLLPKNFTK